MITSAHKTEGVERAPDMRIFHLVSTGKGKRRRNRLRLLRRKVHGPRTHDHEAQRRPAGRQVPEH